MKKLIAVLAVFSGLACSAAATFADTLHLVSDGGQSVGGVDVYPYNFNVDGASSLTSLMCLNFNREITFGETWNVSIVSVNLDNSTASIDQRADAWIFGQLANNSAADVQYAVWDILDPTDVNGHAGYADSPNAQHLASTGLMMAQNASLIQSGYFSQFSLYLSQPTNTAGWTDGQPQDFVGVAQTPEPSSLILLGSGLIGAAGMLRRRLSA